MKVILILILTLLITSCKQEYECCWYSHEEITEDVGFCTINKMSKKDADAAYNQVNELEWKCKEK